MAKAELWKFKPLGCLVGKLGTFPVHRGQIDREAVRHAKAVLVGGAVLGLFPEGHRQRERDLGDIRPGVSLFSLQEGVVTVPVILKGTDRVVKNGILHFPRITAIYGKPIDLPGEDVPKGQRSAVVRERLVQSFHDLLDSTGSARG